MTTFLSSPPRNLQREVALQVNRVIHPEPIERWLLRDRLATSIRRFNETHEEEVIEVNPDPLIDWCIDHGYVEAYDNLAEVGDPSPQGHYLTPGPRYLEWDTRS